MKRSIALAALAALTVLCAFNAAGQGIPTGVRGSVPLCTKTELHAGTCQSELPGYLATITDGNAADADRCASGFTAGGSEQVTCRYKSGDWEEFEPGEGGGGSADLGTTVEPTQVTVTNTAGSNAVLPAAGAGTAGVMTGAHESKLAGLSSLVVLASDFSAGSTTAGIQEAIDSCGEGSTTENQGCVIQAPCGTHVITSGVRIGGTSLLTMQNGISLTACGSGIENSLGGNLAGTTLVWGGTDGGTMLEVTGKGHVVENLMLDGNGEAGYGIVQTGDNDSSSPAGKNTYRNIRIENILDTANAELGPAAGWGIALGTIAGDAQNDFTIFEQVQVANSRHCLIQRDEQAVQNEARMFVCKDFTASPGINIEYGGFNFDEMFLTPGAPDLVGLQIDNCSIQVEWEDGSIEWDQDNGTIVRMTNASGSCPNGEGYKHRIENVRFRIESVATVGHTCVEKNSKASLTLIDNTWSSNDFGAALKCDLEFDNPDPTRGTYITMIGNRNAWANGADVTEIDIAVSNTGGAGNTVIRVDSGEYTLIDSNGTKTMVGDLELLAANGSGPNAGDGLVDWSQLINMPTGLADGSQEAKLAGIEAGATADQIAAEVPFSPSGTGLSSVNVQDALAEISADSGSPYDLCRGGTTKGGGLDASTGRYAWTCGNYNWHADRDPTQATASYDVTCTGDGTPHTSCLRSGEVRHVGYPLHRTALAAQYTADGGFVFLPNGLYVDDGAGTLSDGVTRAEIPYPYDPDWEARPEFAQLGYPTMLTTIVLSRGVRLVGESVPKAETYDVADPTVTTQTPKLTGTWIVDDRGNASGTPGSGGATLDGPNQDIAPPAQYRGILVGGNRHIPYCSTTSDVDPTCNREQEIDGLKYPADMLEWGTTFGTLANITAAAGLICVPDDTWFASNAGSNPDTGTGTCSGNRMIRCWDTSGLADQARSSGGCDFGEVSFGTCESPYDALVTDYVTNEIDYQLAMDLGQCADDASSSSDCEATSMLGHNIYIADFRNEPGEAFNGTSCDSGNGSNVQMGLTYMPSGDFTTPLPFSTFYPGSGVVNIMTPVKRNAMNGSGSGFENIGRMPANWWSRDSATAAASCLSGGDVDLADDEVQCDTETFSAFAYSYNNVIGPNNLFFYSSQAPGNKSGIVETFPSGGPNTFTGNTILTQWRGALSDWGEGYFTFNDIQNFGAAGTAYAMLLCFSDHCRFEDNTIRDSYVSSGMQFTTASAHSVINRNTWRNVRNSGPLYNVTGAKSVLISDERYEEVYGNRLLYLNPGVSHKQQPSVTFRDSRGLVHPVPVASNATTGGGQPATIILVEGDDSVDSRADEYRSLIVKNLDLESNQASTCLVWFEADNRGSSGAVDDAASLHRESAVRAYFEGNNIRGPGSPQVACTGAYEYTASAYDATDSDTWAFERYAPTLRNNRVNSDPVPDMLGTVSESDVPDADDLPKGTVVRIYDGSATACAHTNGDLTSGSSLASCISDPGTSGSDTDGTWVEF